MSVRQENRYKTQSIASFHQVGTLAGQNEALRRASRQPGQQVKTSDTATRRQVRNWLRLNAVDYEGATALAEAANTALSLPSGALDDPDHWIWDEALSALEGA
jgi:hypothetical protein